MENSSLEPDEIFLGAEAKSRFPFLDSYQVVPSVHSYGFQPHSQIPINSWMATDNRLEDALGVRQTTYDAPVEGDGKVIPPCGDFHVEGLSIVIPPVKKIAQSKASVEGVGKVIPPRGNFRVEGRTNVIPPVK